MHEGVIQKMSSESQTPDLASILKTLAGLTPQNNQSQGQYPQAQVLPSRYEQSAQEAWSQNPALAIPLPRAEVPTLPPRNVVDPATIIEWSAGLRCVMKTVAKHEDILKDIRRMIKIQHEHEEQWWNGRKALVERQKARIEGQKKLEEVLKAVGGSTAIGSSNTSPEEIIKELETFDMKVYKAQIQMVREMTSKLRSLGVPFFGTRSDLVRPVGKQLSNTGVDSSGDEKSMIDEADLVKLQRKMLIMLEDLCNED